MQPIEVLMTLREVQQAGKISRATLYRWTREQGLKTIRVGGCVRIRASDWQAWLAQHAESNGEGTA